MSNKNKNRGAGGFGGYGDSGVWGVGKGRVLVVRGAKQLASPNENLLPYGRVVEVK